MRFGCVLPTLGPLGGPDALTRTAQRAEALDYHSVWVADRLLYPLAPRTPYPGHPRRLPAGVLQALHGPGRGPDLRGRAHAPDHPRDEHPQHALLPAGRARAAARHARRPVRRTPPRRPRPGLVGRRARSGRRRPEGAGVAGRRVHRGAEGDVGAGSGGVPGTALPGGALDRGTQAGPATPSTDLPGRLRGAGAPAGGEPRGRLAGIEPAAGRGRPDGAAASRPRPPGRARSGPPRDHLHGRLPRSRARPWTRASAVLSAAARRRCAPTSGGSATSGVTEVIGWSGGDTLDATLAALERFRETVG